jgi:hypothetical protein
MGQGSEVPAYGKNHIASPTPVSAGRPAMGHKFFPPEGNAAVSPLPGSDFYYGFICELLHVIQSNRKEE